MLLWTFYSYSEVSWIPGSIASPNRTIDSHTWKEIQRLINTIHLFHRREKLDSEVVFAGHDYRTSWWQPAKSRVILHTQS